MASSTFLSFFPDKTAAAQPWHWLSLPTVQIFLGSAFLVSFPVFVQAPLVRQAPWVSLVLTLGWLGASMHLMAERSTRRWGSLGYGFTLTWLTGSLYWGWLRTEPLWHMPLEALALPLVIWGLQRGFARIGSYFCLGSLLGTAITDLYIHSAGLLPEWRGVMREVDSADAATAFHTALIKMQSPAGLAWSAGLCLLLLVVGLWGLRQGWSGHCLRQLHWWAFSGAVLSTLLVDSLFWWGSLLVSQ